MTKREKTLQILSIFLVIAVKQILRIASTIDILEQ